jgi:hypothetical protein
VVRRGIAGPRRPTTDAVPAGRRRLRSTPAVKRAVGPEGIITDLFMPKKK